jgi:hypothetical protein
MVCLHIRGGCPWESREASPPLLLGFDFNAHCGEWAVGSAVWSDGLDDGCGLPLPEDICMVSEALGLAALPGGAEAKDTPFGVWVPLDYPVTIVRCLDIWLCGADYAD